MGRRKDRVAAAKGSTAASSSTDSIWLSPRSRFRLGVPSTASRWLLVLTAFLEAGWIVFLLALVVLQSA